MTLSATNGDDVAIVSGSGTEVSVLGLSAKVTIDHAEAANDRLVIEAGAGDDVIEASGLFAGTLGPRPPPEKPGRGRESIVAHPRASRP